ncbi:ribonuclease H-like domain-containing protein [Rhizophagus clarus]|uniref:Ribonuclease H-like domain-containing protein n=1 Tax=Rhizophagus clarus TaxID=94130 RepID=A0A8H3LJQ8_9GLOM|nr:ribonuclease H-like domain-containing protein [Rhizophagus clarus]
MTQSSLSEFFDASAPFHPEAEKDKIVIHYSGEKYLSGLSTLDDIVAENDEGLTTILEDTLSKQQDIPFMTIKNERSTERINETYRYVLRLYGHLINGQKALVTLMGIQVFFDIFVPDEETPDECEEKSIINKYIYKQGKGTSPLYKHEFDVSIKDFCLLEDITTISDRFLISALLWDHTLVLTWNIKTQSQELDEFAEVLDLNHNIFMISMTLHWKDNQKLLKQICLIDVETEPDPRWITIICGNQENLLKAFAFCWQAFVPDIHVGFNDSDYDWIAKSENNYMKKYSVKAPEKGEDPEEKEYMGGPIKIKISAEEDFTSSFLELPVDKKGSLKFFLQKCGHDSKADMPYDKMWKIYLEAKKSPPQQPQEIYVK